MKALVIFLLAIGLTICKDFATKSGSLDPGRITWPKEEWYNNPIDLSQTNAGTPVTLTFNFRPTTLIENGIVQIIFPSTFPSIISPVNANLGTSKISAGVDMSVTTTATLPSNPGFVGPFGIITRSSQTGQIIDANYVFGCIAISDSDIPSSLLSIYSVSKSTKIGSSDSFVFNFPISKSFWKNDIIEVIPPKDWSPSSNPLCSSKNGILIGPKLSTSLPCAVAAKSTSYTGATTTPSSDNFKNSVYIYGVSQDIYTSTKTDISFAISEFNLPPYVVSGTSSLNSWEVKVWRFGTNNIIWHFTGSAIFTMTPGTPQFISWLPRSKITSSDVRKGMTIFTDLTIATENTIPPSGTLSVTFSGLQVYEPTWWKELDGSNAVNGLCYLSPYINGTSCSVDTTQKVTIKFDNYQTTKTFTITVLTNFNSDSPSISKIESKTESLALIDSLIPTNKWVLNTTNILLNDCFFHGYNDWNYPGTTKLKANQIQGGVVGKKLYFRARPGDTAWGGSVSVTLIFNINYSDKISFTKVYIDPKATVSEKIDALTSTTTSLSEGANIYTPSFGTQSPGIYVTIPANSAKQVATTNYYIFAYSSASSTSLPFVASNVATFYEMWAKVEYANKSKFEISSTVFSVMPQTTTSKLYSVPLCTDAVFGIPIVNYFEPISMSFDFGDPSYNFAIDIDIENGYDLTNGFLNTNITTGELKPRNFATNAQGSARAFISSYKLVDSNGTTKIHAVVTLISLGKTTYSSTGSTKITTFIPQNIAKSSSFNVKTIFYYTVSEDPKTKMELYESSTTWTMTNPSNTITAASSSGIFNIGEPGTLTNTLTISSGSITSSDIIGVGMTKGGSQQLPVMSLIINGKTYSSSSPYTADSYNDNALGGFVMTYDFTGYTGTTISTSTSFSVKITNAYPPNQVDKTSGNVDTSYSIWIADGSQDWGKSCKASKVIKSSDGSSTVVINAGKITSPTCSMTVSSGSGLADAALEISFTISHDIPAKGLIEVTLGTNFGWADTDGISTCLSTTLVPSDENAISCKVSSSGSLILTGFNPVSAGTAINISVKHVLPTSSSSSSTSIACFTLVTTQASAGKYIDSWSGSIPVIIDGGSSIGKPTYIAFEVYPNNPGVQADLYLSFSVSKAIPQKGKIIISQTFASWKYSIGTIQDFCWTNIDYLACKIENFNIVITLAHDLAAEKIVEVYIDSAFVLPKITGKTSTGIKIQGTWAGTTLVSDSSTGVLLEVGPKIDALVKINSISIADITNVGENANYKFSFTSAEVKNGDYFVIQFPRIDAGYGFDPYIGDATNPFSVLMPNSFELPCSSSSLGSISCHPSHWYLTVKDISSFITAGTQIDISILNVRNPYMSSDWKFNIFHYDSTNLLKAFGFSSQYTKTIDPSTTKVSFKSISSSKDAQSALATYIFEFYPTSSSDSFTSDTVFYINFPNQFDFNLWKSNSIACSSFICNSVFNATNCDKTWNTNQLCSISGSKVFLNIQSQNAVRMTDVSRVVISIPNIKNPSTGLQRKQSSGWDTADTSTFGSYNFWSSHFEAGAWNKNKLTVSRSYGLLNSCYEGYTQGSSSIGVEYSESVNRIALIPGQQSKDISIKTSNGWPSVDKSIKFIPTISGTGSSYLKISSPFHKLVLKQMHSEAIFRVAALQGIPNGIYYLDWTLSESTQIPDVTMYNAPSSTLIEVHTKPDKLLPINVAKIPKLYVGYSSVPICLALDYSPASSLIITPTFDSGSSGIASHPTSLKFAPNINSICFTIDISSNYYSSGGSTSLSFELSGADSNIFKKPDSITLTISQLSASITQPNLQLSSTVKDGSTASISVVSDYDAIIYWSVSCKGADILSFKDIVYHAPVLTDANSTTLKDMLADEYENKETDTNS